MTARRPAASRLSLEEWAVLVTELAVTCNRYVDNDAKASLAQRYADVCSHRHPRAVKVGIDRWYESLPANPQLGQAPNMPTPKVLNELARTVEGEWAAEAAKRTRPAEPSSTWAPARRDFVAAHLAGQRRLAGLRVGALNRHDHRDGTASCPICGPNGDEFRAEVQAILDALPEPRPETSKCPRHCRGGWLDGQGGIYPCQTCSPTAYGTWLESVGPDQ